MPESIINLIKGDKAGDETDYRDALSVNMHTVIRPMFGVQGYMQQSYGLTLYGSTDLPDAVLKPANIFPSDGAEVDIDSITVRSSAFAYRGDVQAHTKTDWQFASDAGFTNIVHESIDDAVNLVEYDVSNKVPSDAVTYWRVRHYGSVTGASDWSDATTFDATQLAQVVQPTNVFPAEGATVDLNQLVLQSTPFAVEGGAQTHVSSDWQIANDPEFTDIYWESLDDTENLTTVVVAGNPIAQPVNTFPADGESNIDWQAITVTGSAFDVEFGPTQTHDATDWQFASDGAFTNIFHESLGDTQNLESYDVSGNVPDKAVTYWRHRHFGSVTGASDYSATTSFDTSNPILDFNHPNLLVAYTMDNITGNTLNDESPNGRNSTLTNTAAGVGPNGSAALLFNGTSAQTLATSQPSQSATYTVSLWVKKIGTPSAEVIFGDTFTNARLPIIVGTGSILGGTTGDTLYVGTYITSWAGAMSSFSLTEAVGWVHIVATVSAAGSVIYINGAEAATGTAGNNQVFSGMCLGYRWDTAVNRFFSGEIGRTRLFDRVLTQEEITALYTEFD